MTDLVMLNLAHKATQLAELAHVASNGHLTDKFRVNRTLRELGHTAKGYKGESPLDADLARRSARHR